MSNIFRSNILKSQKRSFSEGTALFEEDTWFFFEIDAEEESELEFYLNHELKVYRDGDWLSGVLLEDGIIVTPYERIRIENGDRIQIKKNILYSLENLLEEISDDAFHQFITALNNLGYSIYDSIFCHNHLVFLGNQKIKEGVNFITFDNGVEVCAVQHHFTYYKKKRDRFEFTLSTGRRIVIESFNL
ncbi:DUF2777 domain-containing protein [Rossellomorea aquimaris]|uniref:DUF2777 family protein n=1 Tax=Rossellomorea aquimaris TaxID=189382 RepID=UPI001CD20831|nr:DUF2777 family protein [Rossellomorea aquimaris]MCA1059536.1 DUF2777 domain-containing protein [Rossellomorea aquimaris]